MWFFEVGSVYIKRHKTKKEGNYPKNCYYENLDGVWIFGLICHLLVFSLGRVGCRYFSGCQRSLR